MDTEHKKERARVGIMVVGHREYWSQFPELKEKLKNNAAIFKEMVAETNVNIITQNRDFVETPEQAVKTGTYFKEKDIDLLFVYIPTYVASGRYVSGILKVNVPTVIVGLQDDVDLSTTTISSMTGSGSPCPMPEAYSALTRVGKEPDGIIFGRFHDDRVQQEIDEWCRAAAVLRSLQGSIIGYLGHSYEGMYDMNSDPTSFTGAFGIHVKMLEMCELVQYVKDTKDKEIKEKIQEMKETFMFADESYDPTTKPIRDNDVAWAAQCAVGLDKLVECNHLSGLAYYYEGLDNYYERVASNLIIGNSMLTSRGISLAGEADLKTCAAMLTTGSLGAGGSFAELCLADFNEDILLVGHDGPHDIRISDSQPVIRGLGLYHGKRGYGISVEFSIKSGDMSMVGLSSDENGQFKFVVAEGESLSGPVPEVGNTLTRGYFGEDVDKFVERWCEAGPSHHVSLCVEHVASMMKKLGKIWNIEVEVVE